MGQLTRVNDPNGSTFGTTWIYSYDRGGNTLNKSAYVYTTGTVGTVVRSWAYGYDDPNWKDKLTSFDGHTITYDAIGNPLNDGEWTYEWQAGRQLKRMSKTEDGNTFTMEFSYDYAGLRTKKVRKVNGVAVETTEYILNGKNVVGLIYTNHATNTVNELHFQYDAQGRAALIDFNGAGYSYAHNLQGDIIGILDGNGELVVEYRYDAWGKPVSTDGTLTTTLGELNPFRYRGYVWDGETELYYLRSRYYSTSYFRFCNLDDYCGRKGRVLSHNTYMYCSNNPPTYLDENGHWFGVAVLLVAITLLLTGCSTQNEYEPYAGQANCYAFAFNLKVDPLTKEPFIAKPQPGGFSGNPVTLVDLLQPKDKVKQIIEDAVKADGEVLGFTITEVDSADYACSNGEWLVALAYAPSLPDYHWWKRNEDATWFHKPGSTPIQEADSSGNIIIDPKDCNRGVYTEFLGYYLVSY